MSRIVLDAGGLRVEIEPRLGAGIAGLSWRVPGRGLIPLMRPTAPRTTWFNDLACYVLAPWSNRVAGAGFEWKGKRHQLMADWPDGTAIHGLVKDRVWRIEQRSPVSAVLACEVPAAEFPWAFWARVAYRLEAGLLRVGLEVGQPGAGASASERRREGSPLSSADTMPVGLGFHPFWLRALDDGEDEVQVRLPGLKRYPCEKMIPAAHRAAHEDEVTRALARGTGLAGMELDEVFAGSAHGAEILWARSGVRVRYRCSEELGHTVVFTGLAGSFCLEPVTMVNDGFNLTSRRAEGTGVRGLAKGETMRVEWVIEAGTI